MNSLLTVNIRILFYAGREGVVVVYECAGDVTQATKVSGNCFSMMVMQGRCRQYVCGAPAIQEASPLVSHTVQ